MVIHSWLNGVWGAGDTGNHGLYWASVTGEGSSGTAARVMVGWSCRGLSVHFIKEYISLFFAFN